MKTAVFPAWLAIGLSAFFLQSCCKGYCSDETIFAMDFEGFAPAEMDKIKIVAFNAAIAVDSYYVSTNNIIKKDTTRVYPDKPLRSDYNFEIILENAGLNYRLTAINTKKEDCNCGSGTYKTITGYSLNGLEYTSPEINPLVIRK